MFIKFTGFEDEDKNAFEVDEGPLRISDKNVGNRFSSTLLYGLKFSTTLKLNY